MRCHSGAPRSGEPGIHNHWPRAIVLRFHGMNHIDINYQPRPAERAPERLSKDARVSKDGHTRDRARGLLRTRSEGLISIVRCDWFHGIDLLQHFPVNLNRKDSQSVSDE